MGAGAGSGSGVRAAVWVLHMAIPLLALWLLIEHPDLDGQWEHHGAHFGLVLVTAAINVVLGVLVGRAAARRGDARLFLVSLAFVVSAGFLGLHALATPGIFLGSGNAGFVIATPVGLGIAAVLAAVSAFEFDQQGAARVLRLRNSLRWGIAAVLAAWGGFSLGGLPPLDATLPPEEVEGPLVAAAFGGAALYGWAALRYFAVHRRRPAVMLLSVITAFVLLAEAMFSIAFGRNWHASWWEWHVLMTLAFGFVAYSAHVQYRREGSPAGLFHGVALDRTLVEVKRDLTQALEEMVAALGRRAEGVEAEGEATGRVAARLGDRFDLTERQLEVLERAAGALGFERAQKQRLGALVGIAREASVIRPEEDLLGRALTLARDAFAPDELELVLTGEPDTGDPVRDEALRRLEPVERNGRDGGAAGYVVPLGVKGNPAGVLEARRRGGSFDETEQALLRSLAGQLSMALENARLYQQIEGLFRSYMSPSVATALLADPERAGLGGSIADVTVLFADLRGFTPFSERSSPEEVMAMLNTFYTAIVPEILAEDGTVTQFVGDEVMAVFGAPVRQPDHAERAGRAGLRLQAAAERVAAGRDGWPRFGVGLNSGPVLVGNVGSQQVRNFTAIGDTTNLAARLQSTAKDGEVVISEATYARLGEAADVEALGELAVKGKAHPVRAYRLLPLASGSSL